CSTVFIGTLALAWRLLKDRVDTTLLRRTALILVTASMFGANVETFYGETLTACGVLLGVILLAIDRPLAAGIAMIIAVWNTPVAVVALTLCNFAWWLRTRRTIDALWPIVTSVVLVLLEFQIRRGSPFRSGYEGDLGYATVLPFSGKPGFSYPIILGI